MESVRIKAYGKVNLGLDVTGKRPDGYHLVKMVMQTVDVYDVITVTGSQYLKAESIPEKYRITINCDAADVPTDQTNLAYKAAQLICDEFDIRGDISISIEKHIPAAAGMAGGSADGAAVIQAMNQLFALRLSQEQKDAIALKLGADVPFCLRKGTYLAEGIGEKLTRLDEIPHCYMIIVKPDFSISTPWAYKMLDTYLQEHGDGKSLHPDMDGLLTAINRKDLDQMAECMGNILELAAVPAHPQIQQIKDELLAAGAVKSLMSGSGPTVFGIFKEEESADKAYLNLKGGKYGKFKVEF